MSHSRVSLGRIAFPCITGGVEGRFGDQGRGGAPERAPGRACRARRSRRRPFFSHRPPRHLSTLDFLLMRATSLCCARRRAGQAWRVRLA